MAKRKGKQVTPREPIYAAHLSASVLVSRAVPPVEREDPATLPNPGPSLAHRAFIEDQRSRREGLGREK